MDDLPEYQAVAEKVTVGFTGVAETDSGDSESCTASVTVTIGDAKTAQCDVTFHLRPGESQNVTARWRSSGLMTFKPDTGDLAEKADAAVAKVLDAL